MDHPMGLAPARPAARALVIAIATVMGCAIAGSGLLAQTPPAPGPAPAQKGKAPAPKAQPKAAPTAPNAAHPAPAEQAQSEQPQLIFSPWTKFCVKGQEAEA